MHFSIGIYDAEHLTTKGTAAMYIVFTGHHESKRRCAPVAQGVCGPAVAVFRAGTTRSSYKTNAVANVS